MKLFGQLVRTAVNVATLPVAIAKDAVTLGNIGARKTYTQQALEELKEEASGE